jgi:hypothetical protein
MLKSLDAPRIYLRLGVVRVGFPLLISQWHDSDRVQYLRFVLATTLQCLAKPASTKTQKQRSVRRTASRGCSAPLTELSIT